MILVESLDRLSRDVVEAMQFHERLRLRGIGIVGVSEGLDTVGRQPAPGKGPYSWFSRHHLTLTFEDHLSKIT